ncbi:hypothetical protein [Streptomyces sp. NPDC051286]|uniref:hypothetical protein n=1 Tax=Streptomyces sp. NPDC051286 TaxID=3365647 RepID=UPI0037A3A8D7
MVHKGMAADLADLVDADGVLPAIEPGVRFEADDLGRWLERQANGAVTLLGASTSSRCHLSPGRGRRRRSALA